MSTRTFIEATPEEIVSRVAAANESIIRKVVNEQNRPEPFIGVPDAAKILQFPKRIFERNVLKTLFLTIKNLKSLLLDLKHLSFISISKRGMLKLRLKLSRRLRTLLIQRNSESSIQSLKERGSYKG